MRSSGIFTIRFIDDARKIARLGFVIVDDTKKRAGLRENKLVSLAVAYAFDKLKADKGNIGRFENNASAIRCYLSCGF